MVWQAGPKKNGKSIRNIRVELIERNPEQPRKIFNEEELRSLSESIRMYGVLNPITVRRTANGYELIAGERRLRASRMAGMQEIPCIVIHAERRDSALISLVENLQRKDLNFFEEALGFKRLIEVYGLTQEEAARSIGKTQSAVANKLRILKLEKEVCAVIIEAGLSERHARALLKLPTRELRLKALEAITIKSLNVLQTEEYIDRLLAEPETKPERTKVLIKDVRLFLNTIDHAVRLMKKSGIQAEYAREDVDGEIVLTVRIPEGNKRSV